MAGKFVLSKSTSGKFHFVLKAGNGETILTSEHYEAKASAENGIASVKENAPKDERYEKKNAKNGSPMFNLKAANGQVIGTSETFSSESARDATISWVKANAPRIATEAKNAKLIENQEKNTFPSLSPSLPSADVIPAQTTERAIAFIPSRHGPLDLLSDPPKDPWDPEQNELYRRIRHQLRKIKNEIPSQERTQIDNVIDDFLDQPEQWHQVEFKKVLWLCGNGLRNVLSQHDTVKNSTEPHYSKLPPTVAEALRRPVESWNIFILGDSDLVALDSIRMGPLEQASALQNIAAAKPILVSAAQDRCITTDTASRILDITARISTAETSNINAKQAQTLADGTSQNLIYQLIRQAYLFYQDIVDPQTEEARQLATEYKLGVAKKAGEMTIVGVTAAVATAALYSPAFFEFVAIHASELKNFINITMQNIQLTQIVDAIAAARKHFGKID